MEIGRKRVAIITGASNGIGRCLAYEYAQKGYRVVLADVCVEKGTNNVQHIQESGGEAIFVPTDVRKPEQIVHLIQQAMSAYGRIDVLINNVGKMLRKSPYEASVDEWDDVLQTNLRSVFLTSREAAKHMKKNEQGGAIVNIASTRAMMSEPYTELYAASKGGIVSLTHALAASFSDDRITVNAVSPGWIETGDYSQLTSVDHEQHFSKRVGKPEDIARACLYLTAESNDFVTGTNLVVDGGMTKKMIYEE
ncbi:MAG: glucose 1-dehydrogenase [Bacillus sp. (in: firmicutes)]